MVRSLRIVYMGTPQFAVPTFAALLASAHTVCGVVTQPDRPRGRGRHVSAAPVKALAMERGIPVCQPERLRAPDVLETLKGWAPDLGVVAAYGRIIPESMLDVPALGMINVHASLLPRWRGAAPVHRAVIAGDPETGVTIMRVVPALDAGAALARVVRPIGPDETSDSVERALSELGASLLVAVVDRLANGTVREEAQDDALVTYAARLTKEEGLVDWSAPALVVHNRVRGLHPWPHAYSFLAGRRLILRRTRLVPGRSPAPHGTVLSTSPDGFDVATGDGQVRVEEVQPEGRRPMAARDFMAGHPVHPGDRFTDTPQDIDTARGSS